PQLVNHRGAQFTVRGVATAPASPQRHPVLLQAGDSADGRDFGAKHADALFTIHSSIPAGQKYYADVKARAVAHGRNPDQLKVFPGVTYVLGDTEQEAVEKAAYIRDQQVGPQTALAYLEQVWGRDLSGYDPDGPLPDVEPTGDDSITRGKARHGDPREIAAKYREIADAKNLSIRELIKEVTSRQQFIGTPAQVAAEVDRYIQADACDGFILVPHLTPAGLDDFVDTVVPLLQERGAFRGEYEHETLREHLGLAPVSGSSVDFPRETASA
ncbi:MAG: LLM class flavin-dependent oxidoreductase, partial [[Mycobacterium] stephanolepidis]